MPEYRWGIFLEPAQPDAKVGFGDNYGAPAYQEVPGEFRNALRRIIVTQGDTEPASVEQQRHSVIRVRRCTTCAICFR
jgi:benzoyl-CoA 2,3-dioxygenase component B